MDADRRIAAGKESTCVLARARSATEPRANLLRHARPRSFVSSNFHSGDSAQRTHTAPEQSTPETSIGTIRSAKAAILRPERVRPTRPCGATFGNHGCCSGDKSSVAALGRRPFYPVFRWGFERVTRQWTNRKARVCLSSTHALPSLRVPLRGLRLQPAHCADLHSSIFD